MKKVLSFALVAASFSFTSCGSSDTTEVTTTTEISSVADSTDMQGGNGASLSDSNTSPESAGVTTSGAASTDTITTRQ